MIELENPQIEPVEEVGTYAKYEAGPLQAAGLEVNASTDVTPIPHNGCRTPKRRRV